MGIRQVVALLLVVLPLSGTSSPALFLVQTGNTHDAIRAYLNENGKDHNYELLQQIALTLLDQGSRSSEMTDQLLAIYGAGISMHDRVMYILERGVASANPQIQLVSMQLLARHHNAEAYQALNGAMRSNNLIVRLEAAHLMAQIKHPKAIGQIEALMHKLPLELHVVFPELFAIEGTGESIRALQKLLRHPKEAVRVAAIVSAGQHQRDDLAPQIRRMTKHHGVIQQEACAFTLGLLQDEESVSSLEELIHSTTPNVKLAALHALYRLGHKEHIKEIIRLARLEDLFAVSMLASIEETEPVLKDLLHSPSAMVRFNAAIALLQHHDASGVPFLEDLFFPEQKDLAITKATTAGSALSYWKPVHGASMLHTDEPIVYELSLQLRESVLLQCLDLPDSTFLGIVEHIFKRQQNDLVPIAAQLLYNKQTPEAITLLKRYQQQLGAPLIRMYCTLALYKLEEEGSYAKTLQEWATMQQGEDFIQLRPYVPWEMRDRASKYVITPREASRLLLEAFEAFAAAHDDQAINVVLEAIQHGNKQNRYALAGLLIRMVL